MKRNKPGITISEPDMRIERKGPRDLSPVWMAANGDFFASFPIRISGSLLGNATDRAAAATVIKRELCAEVDLQLARVRIHGAPCQCPHTCCCGAR